MNTIFVGGSRHASRLPSDVRHRLDNIVASGHRVIVGDANGADKAVQKHLHEAAYTDVTVFCSGDHARNNLGRWPTRNIEPPRGAKGFQFYAAKDRVMALEADFGLMIWDGKSPGTVLNVLRLMRLGKIAVLFDVPGKRAHNIKSLADWDRFLARCSDELRRDLQDRATPDEWSAVEEPALIALAQARADDASASPPEDQLAASLNAALAVGDSAAAVDALGGLAKAHGMSQVAKQSGLARESLYRALGHDGNPEFATVLKVLSSLGLRLSATPAKGH